MKRIPAIAAALTLCAFSALANTEAFRAIAASAGKIEKDALAISKGLRAKSRDLPAIQTSIHALGADIAALRQEVDKTEASTASLTEAQKKSWELIKTKVQLLMIFQDRKAELSAQNLEQNRTRVRDLADGIAKRAKMLQKTAGSL